SGLGPEGFRRGCAGRPSAYAEGDPGQAGHHDCSKAGRNAAEGPDQGARPRAGATLGRVGAATSEPRREPTTPKMKPSPESYHGGDRPLFPDLPSHLATLVP